MQRLRSGFFFFCALAAVGLCSAAIAAPQVQVEGEYQCDECHGFLTIKRENATELQIWLGVGGGSCGGAPAITRKVRYAAGVLKVPYKQGQKQCMAQIEFTAGGASVTDTCLSARDEENSTCATLGSYTRRKQ